MNIKKWFKSLEPKVLGMLSGRLLKPLKPLLDKSDVLSFQRQPLAMGVAIGCLFGLIPTPFQTIATVVACMLLRANIVAGIVATFYTNPLTIIPIYAFAFKVGQWVLPGNTALPSIDPIMQFQFASVDWFKALSEWILSLGTPLLVGLPIVGLVFAVIGYYGFELLWRLPVWIRMRKKSKKALQKSKLEIQ
jgi:uncharacterized protein (DUF2062 family)